jgi:hypothetical protein
MAAVSYERSFGLRANGRTAVSYLLWHTILIPIALHNQ